MSRSDPALRARIDDALGDWGRFVARHRWVVVVLSSLLTLWLGSFVPSMVVKMASEDFLFEDDPVRALYDAFKEDFGQDQIATLSITPREVFDIGFLHRLEALHRDLENEVPYLEDLTSLVNVRSTWGRGDELVVEDLLDDMPETGAELAAFRERVLTTPFYKKSGVISEDGRSTGIRVEVAVYGDGEPSSDFDSDAVDLSGFEDGFGEEESVGVEKKAFLSGAENVRVVEAMLDVIARHDSPDMVIRVAGGTMMTYVLTRQLGHDVPIFVGGGLVVMSLLLWLLFRRMAAIVLAILVVVPAAISTFGLSSALGLAFSAPGQIIPSFLLAIGVSYSVHLVTIFMTELGRGVEKTEAIARALHHSGLPILMTGLTTSAGLLSFLSAEMKPIAEMGMISSIGVGVMLFYAMVLLPALLAILPLGGRVEQQEGSVDRLLRFLAHASATHPRPILGATVVLVIVAGIGMSRLYASSDPVSWFPKTHPYRVATDELGARFGGTYAIELVVDTGKTDGVKDPELLRRLDRIADLAQERRAMGDQISYTTSLVDIVKETHQALNENDPADYAIPDDPELLAQELILFENSGSDDLEKIVDSLFSRTRYTVRSYWTDGTKTKSFLEHFQPSVREIVGDLAEVQVTGISALIARTVDAVYESMIQSYALALALITPLMILLIGSLRAGLVSMVPNLVPILLTLGLMGFTGIAIDMFTLLAGCIAIGLAVDDSIHFISGFRRYRAEGFPPVEAVDRTMQSTGRALLFTSIVLTTGFAVLTFSEMLNLWSVGVLTTFAIGAAFVLDVTVTPALLVMTHRREQAAAESANPGIAATTR